MEEEVVVTEAPIVAPEATPAPSETPEVVAPNTAESAPAPKPEGEKQDTPEQAKSKAEARRDRKLQSAYRREAEARARAQLLEEELSKYKQQPGKQPGEPQIADFDDIEKYAEAKAEFRKTQYQKEQEAKQHSSARQQAEAKLLTDWETKAARADSKYEDFDEVVGELKPTSPWAVAVMEADNAEDIAYWLGKNMAEAQRIAKLPPVSQIREIGKLEAKLAAEPAKPKTPSKAPAPIAPVSGASTAPSGEPSADDTEAWIKWRTKQVHAKRNQFRPSR